MRYFFLACLLLVDAGVVVGVAEALAQNPNATGWDWFGALAIVTGIFSALTAAYMYGVDLIGGRDDD